MRTGLRGALLALVSAALLALAGCGDDGPSDEEARDARTLLERAFANGVDSGDTRLDLRLDLEGLEGLDKPISLRVDGPYESRGQGRLPRADWDLTARFEGATLRAGLKLTGDKAYLDFEGDSYSLGSGPFGDGDGRRDDGGLLTGLRLDASSWLDDPQLEEGQPIGGDPTRKVSGALDPAKVARDLIAALRSPQVKRELGPAGELIAPPRLTQEHYDNIHEVVDELSFEANVDRDDVLRRMKLEAAFHVPDGDGPGGLQSGQLSIDYVLEEVDSKVDVETPRNPQPLGELLRQFGLPDVFGLTERQ